VNHIITREHDIVASHSLQNDMQRMTTVWSSRLSRGQLNQHRKRHQL